MKKEDQLSFWQLACINGSYVGLPGIFLGGVLSQDVGPLAAITSIIIGNFLLWIIGLGIISMAYRGQHAIENIKNYLGKSTSYFAALIWVLSFTTWYTLQIKGATQGFENVYPTSKPEQIVVLGVILGVATSLISLGGIRLIQRMCVIGLPLMACYLIYVFATSSHTIQYDGLAISISKILTVILFWLTATVNLPTIFRYSRSNEDSVLGLSIATMIRIFFQLSGIFVGVSNFTSHSNLIIFALFILISFVLSNLLNIYFASAVWDTIFSKYISKLKYVFIGFFGSVAYVIFYFANYIYDISYSMEFIELLLLSFISSLGCILLIGFMIHLVVRHRPNPFEKLWCSFCWLIGCSTSFYYQFHSNIESNIPLIKGIVASILSFLVILFIEETVWSVRHVQKADEL